MPLITVQAQINTIVDKTPDAICKASHSWREPRRCFRSQMDRHDET